MHEHNAKKNANLKRVLAMWRGKKILNPGTLQAHIGGYRWKWLREFAHMIFGNIARVYPSLVTHKITGVNRPELIHHEIGY